MNDPISAGSSSFGAGSEETGGLESVYHSLRLLFGLLFLLGGLYLYCQVLSSMSDLLSGTSNYPLLEKFVSSEARTITLPRTGETVALPPVFFTGMGYGLVAFMGTIVVSIANTMIRGGVSLIQPDAKALINRLKRELTRKSG